MQFSGGGGSRTCTSTWCRGMADQPERQGSAGLRLPGADEATLIPERERDELALTIRAALDV